LEQSINPKESLLLGVESLLLRESNIPIGTRINSVPPQPDVDGMVGMNVTPLFLAQVANNVVNKFKAGAYVKRLFTGKACTNVVA
jgi:hypothetical protein